MAGYKCEIGIINVIITVTVFIYFRVANILEFMTDFFLDLEIHALRSAFKVTVLK